MNRTPSKNQEYKEKYLKIYDCGQLIFIGINKILIMKVKVKFLNDKAKMPFRKEREDGLKDFCFDLYATSCEEVAPNVYRYGIGLAFQLEREKMDNLLRAFSVRARSSVWKTGMVLANSVPTIDEGYTGEIMLVFYHIMPNMPKYNIGDRIGQIYVDSAEELEFVKVEKLDETKRGEGGFGSTGTK